MKASITLLASSQAIVGPHVGDLDALESRAALEAAARDLPALFGVAPQIWACDRHPDYASSALARRQRLPVTAVQHHHAHIAACMAEHGLEGPVLGLAWDGTGLGEDGTLWGGEFLRVTRTGYSRIGTFRGFALPGGDHAARRPAWSAVGALQAFRPESMPGLAVQLLGLPESEVRQLQNVLATGQAPRTSSVGRWFDVVAALTGLCRNSTFEGQAAMALEWSLASAPGQAAPYPVPCTEESGLCLVDSGALLRGVLDDVLAGVAAGAVSARFHQTLAEAAAAVLRGRPERQVILSGGCFQNRHLTELIIQQLRREGFTPYWHQQVPPNDGGISLGQAWVVAYS